MSGVAGDLLGGVMKDLSKKFDVSALEKAMMVIPLFLDEAKALLVVAKSRTKLNIEFIIPP